MPVASDLISLFVLSFLAATVIPLGSEWLLVMLLVKSGDALSLVLVATLGNSLGALTTYGIGIWGGAWVISSVLGISEKSRIKAETMYKTYGSWSLLFTWLPILGDALCVMAGVFKLRILVFAPLVVFGKLVRYSVVAGLTLGFTSL